MPHAAGTTLGPHALARYLRGRDVGCPRCAANLRDTTDGRCPGCGEELRLGIGLADPYLAAWVALAIGLCVPAGVGLFCIFILAQAGWPPPPMYLVTLAIVYFLAAIPLAVVALAGRRRFLRMARGTQRGWAIGACCLTAAAFVAFVIGIWR